MQNIAPGIQIGIPCDVSEGAFEGEILVEFETIDGRITGFANTEDVREIDGENFIKAEVVSVESDHLVVKVSGSFFTTNGLANVQPNQMQLAA